MGYSVRKLEPFLQYGEKNMCPSGHGSFENKEISKNWKCPVCESYLSISSEIDGRLHSVQRVPVSEITNNDLIALNDSNIWEIIDARKNEDGKSYRLAIRSYNTINADASSIITRISGSWSNRD